MITAGKKISIIGGGISGLSYYHFLTKSITRLNNKNTNNNNNNQLQYDIHLYEAKDKVGGWIQSFSNKGVSDNNSNNNEYTLERGPRSLRVAGNGKHTLDLVSELRLDNKVIFASSNAKTRFILLDGKIQKMPQSFIESMSFASKYGLFGSVFTEPFKAKRDSTLQDESVQSFFERRFGQTVAQLFIEPLTLGIFGGDYSSLSIKSCFPSMEKLESSYGSLIKGNILHSFGNKQSQQESEQAKLSHDSIRRIKSIQSKDIHHSGVFSFQNGLSTLTSALEQSIPSNHLVKNSPLEKVMYKNGQYTLWFGNGKQVGGVDALVSTCPLYSLGKAFQQQDTILANLLLQQEYSNIAVINFVFNDIKVKEKISHLGFGYLIPSKENQPVLGVAIDSNTFPQFVNGNNVILTVMIGGNSRIAKRNPSWIDVLKSSDQELIEIAAKHLQQFLGIDYKQSAIYTKSNICRQAIPHYSVNHSLLIDQINQHVQNNYSNSLFIGGNSFNGVGVNDAIYNSKLLSLSLLNSSNNK